jgi:hypothetical protein
MKLTVFLRGGLGNQLFQYACGLHLSDKYNLKLFFDNITGFRKDVVYNRVFSLNEIVNHDSVDISSFWMYKCCIRSLIVKYPRLSKTYFRLSSVIYEGVSSFNFKKRLSSHYFLDGYWQDPKYMDLSSTVLSSKLRGLFEDTELDFSVLNLSANQDFIAIGVRLYEETTNACVYHKSGTGLDFDRLNATIRALSDKHNLPVRVFCASRVKELSNIFLPENGEFFIGDENSLNDVATLRLFSESRFRVITVSSFYWWGAWISENVFSKSIGSTYCYNDFINPKLCLDEWKSI